MGTEGAGSEGVGSEGAGMVNANLGSNLTVTTDTIDELIGQLNGTDTTGQHTETQQTNGGEAMNTDGSAQMQTTSSTTDEHPLISSDPFNTLGNEGSSSSGGGSVLPNN